MSSRQASTAPGRQPVAGEVAAREADGAELEAAGVEDLALAADDQLGRAAADVAHEGLAVVHRHGLQHAEVDEAGLLEPRDHLDVDADLARPLDEHGPVLGLADGRGGHGAHGRAVDRRHLAEAGQRLDATRHRRRGEPLHVARRRPEAHHLLLALDDLDAVLVDPGNDEVDRVRADVDRGEDVRHPLLRRQPTLTCRRPSRDDPGRRRVVIGRVLSSAMAKPAKRHVPAGRVTPKGSGSGGRVTPKDGSERRPGQSTRYTPPIPREVKVSPAWVPVLMFTLLGLGLVVIFLNYLDAAAGGHEQRLPGARARWPSAAASSPRRNTAEHAGCSGGPAAPRDHRRRFHPYATGPSPSVRPVSAQTIVTSTTGGRQGAEVTSV